MDNNQQTMRAALYRRPGRADQVLTVEDMARPHPRSGEVLVRIHASGVNPSDVAMRSGAFLQPGLESATIIPHSDGAGIVEGVGDSISNTRIGERVWIWNAQWKRSAGTAAEYITVPSTQAVTLPDNITFEEGAAFGVPLFTAWQAVNLLGPIAGKTVLVTGGAGAVAQYAIQLAKISGARVLTTVSGNHKAKIATNAGADVAINYRQEDVPTHVLALTDGAGVDAAIDLDVANNGAVIARAVRDHGTIIVYGTHGQTASFPAVDMIVKSLAVRFFIVYEMSSDDREAAIKALTALLRAGQLRTNIYQILPLNEIAEAHQIVESGNAVGNVVVAIS